VQPIGPLMHEHRLIERMVELIKKQAARIGQGDKPDSELIADAVEFFRMYADRCHHGKEEDLLFRELEKVDLAPSLTAMMAELIEDHKYGRRLVGELHQANVAYLISGEGPENVMDLLNKLARFYPKHIEKEDKHFFFPIMSYFTRQEMDRMLEDFEKFDQRMIHDFFRGRVGRWEESESSP